MTGLTWGPPAVIATLAGAAGLALWLALAPPGRDGIARGALRSGAALLLLLALLDIGCRRAGPAGARRLVVLLDRSLSMEVAPPGAESRAGAARAWLASPTFAEWSDGWRVEIDSFGGTTSDPAAAIESAETGLPGAILVVSDGRAAGGRVAEPAGIPLYAVAPGAAGLPDAAVLELSITLPAEGSAEVAVEVAAVGGLSLERPGAVTVAVDGREVGHAPVPPLAAGEQHVVRIALPGPAAASRLVEARVAFPGDPVPGNDRRARFQPGDGGPRRALAVGLRPGWDFAAYLRVLPGSHPGPVDGFWTADGGLRRLVVDPVPTDRGARPRSAPIGWTALDPARYGALYLFGDPAALTPAGRAWIERFLGAGGRGLLWAPGGRSGTLSGTGVTVPAGAGRPGSPALTGAGAAWLTARGITALDGPNGSAAWTPLEALPADPPAPPAGSTVLLESGGRPVAWTHERGVNRIAILLGTGYYRWPIVAPGGDGQEEAAAFWEEWTDGLARWLGAASPLSRPLVRMPVGGRADADGRLEAPIATEVDGAVRWRVEREGGQRQAASGIVEPGADPRAIRTGPLPPGTYRLLAEAGQRRARERFVVETWAPDLAWTAADTASLAAAARATGGGLAVDGRLPPLPATTVVNAEPTTAERAFGLGTFPGTFLVAALLLLADWALAGRPRRTAARHASD
ncbi:MAG TPA: hypothetical protein VM737_01895 [Gemmatimonadota bacterium]|nr:hypothetical protein [Gemmatimonadota bacterium]